MRFIPSSLIQWFKGLINVDVSLSFEGGSTFSVSAEISMEMVKQITENEAAYVWSDFYNCAVAIDDLIFSHNDTKGVAGYRVAGTKDLVWRDQLSSVALNGGY